MELLAPSRSASFLMKPRRPLVTRCKASKQVLLVGVTGNTGRSALSGLLATGMPANQLAVLTRNPQSPNAQLIRDMGVDLVACDLDQPAALSQIMEGFGFVYCHALSSDGRTADPKELDRARTLAAAAKAAAVQHVIYHSSGGRGCGYGISQMEQKHKVEDILSAASVPLTCLQAPMLMEEWWKKHTRPSILKGEFPLSIPGNTPVQLLSAYDLGTAVSKVVEDPGAFKGRSFELAADELSPLGMCEAFAQVQGSPVKHSRPPAWPFWFLARDLYNIIRFLKEEGFHADVAQCRRDFPGLLTFLQFLQVTQWKDPGRTFEQGISYSRPAAAGGQAPPPSQQVMPV